MKRFEALNSRRINAMPGSSRVARFTVWRSKTRSSSPRKLMTKRGVCSSYPPTPRALRAGARRPVLLLLAPRVVLVIVQKPGKCPLDGRSASALDAARILDQRVLQLQRDRVPIEHHGDAQAPQHSLFLDLPVQPVAAFGI